MRFYFHLRQGARVIHKDAEGLELGDWESAYLEAYRSAQELASLLEGNAQNATSYCFEVKDVAGTTVLSLPFAETMARERAAPEPDAGGETGRHIADTTRALVSSIRHEVAAAQETLRSIQRLLGGVGSFGSPASVPPPDPTERRRRSASE